MTRTITRGQFILEQYTLLINELQNTGLLKEEIFPSLDDYDVSDIIVLFQMTFSDSDNYDKSIIQLLDYKNIILSDKDQQKVISIILPYLELFRKYT